MTHWTYTDTVQPTDSCKRDAQEKNKPVAKGSCVCLPTSSLMHKFHARHKFSSHSTVSNYTATKAHLASFITYYFYIPIHKLIYSFCTCHIFHNNWVQQQLLTDCKKALDSVKREVSSNILLSFSFCILLQLMRSIKIYCSETRSKSDWRRIVRHVPC